MNQPVPGENADGRNGKTRERPGRTGSFRQGHRKAACHTRKAALSRSDS